MGIFIVINYYLLILDTNLQSIYMKILEKKEKKSKGASISGEARNTTSKSNKKQFDSKTIN